MKISIILNNKWYKVLVGKDIKNLENVLDQTFKNVVIALSQDLEGIPKFLPLKNYRLLVRKYSDKDNTQEHADPYELCIEKKYIQLFYDLIECAISLVTEQSSKKLLYYHRNNKDDVFRNMNRDVQELIYSPYFTKLISAGLDKNFPDNSAVTLEDAYKILNKYIEDHTKEKKSVDKNRSRNIKRRVLNAFLKTTPLAMKDKEYFKKFIAQKYSSLYKNSKNLEEELLELCKIEWKTSFQ